MAVFCGTIRSSVLDLDTQVQVILPYDRPAEGQQEPCKVLYLLHGLGENSTAWCRYTAIERYARQYGLAVIMPEVQRSFYSDMCYGGNYLTYVTLELPLLCQRMFHITRSPANTFVAGLSMGGYGALKCAFTHPELYSAAASFSGPLDMQTAMESFAEQMEGGEMQAIIGPELQLRDGDDVLLLAKEASASPHCPRILVTCGEQDYLWDMNQAARDYFRTLPLDFAFRSWEGTHQWDFWDQSIQLALRFFLEPEKFQQSPVGW